jgi:hypothetical protein
MLDLKLWCLEVRGEQFDLSDERSANKTAVRFNRIAWGAVDATRPRGVIAAGMENGELGIWDPAKILAGVEYVWYRQHRLHTLTHCAQHVRILDSQKHHSFWAYSWS